MIGKEIKPFEEITKDNLDEFIGGYFLLLDYTDMALSMHDFKN